MKGQTIHPELDARLKKTLDSMLIKVSTKSLSAAIQMKDNAIWADAKGISSILPKVDVTTHDVYLIGSVTKTITSACILQLQEEGLLNINDSLHQWLDTMQYINPNVTIRQLLQHTSGIYDVLQNPSNQPILNLDLTKIWTPEELIQNFIKPPLFQPGASWSYCNTGYFLLDMIIKKATGRRFYQEYRDRFFTPMQLNSFAIPSFEPMNSPVAHVWLDITGDGITDDAHNYYISHNALNSTGGAAGGYYSTPTDCSIWMRSLMSGKILGETMMNELEKTVNSTTPGGKYGLGIMKNTILGYEAWGHGGDLGYHASSWYFPALDISISVFNNDGAKTSWDLLPVVAALIKTYTQNISLSSENLRDDLMINVYPNPFTDRIEIKLPENMEGKLSIDLIDETGKIVKSKIIDKTEAAVNLEGLKNLKNGPYFLNITSGAKIIRTMKFIKV